MITIKQIRTTLAARDYRALRALHDVAKSTGIECCDDRQLSTVNLCIIECSLFGDQSPGHLRALSVMLDAVERGNHPYSDPLAVAAMEAEAATAQTELDNMIGGANA